MTSLARDALRPVQSRIKSVGRSASAVAKDANNTLSWAGGTADDYLDEGAALARSLVSKMEGRPGMTLLAVLGAGLLLGHIFSAGRR